MAIRTIDIPHLTFNQLAEFINNDAAVSRISSNARLYEARWDPQYPLIPLITRIFENTVEIVNRGMEFCDPSSIKDVINDAKMFALRHQAINDDALRQPTLNDSQLNLNIHRVSRRSLEPFIQRLIQNPACIAKITNAPGFLFESLMISTSLAMNKTKPVEGGWWQSRILMSAENNPTNEALTVFAPNKFSKDSIQDPRIKRRTMFDQVDMTRKGGICRGEVQIFISRFLKTKPAFTNTKVHLITLAEEFYDGGPPESLVIQQLGFSSVEDISSSSHILSLSNVHNNSNKNEMIQQTKNLPSGIYNCSLNEKDEIGHALVLIKTSEGAYYIFDPNFGLLSLNGAEEVLNFIQEIYKDMTEYSFSLCQGKAPFLVPYDISEIISSPNRNVDIERISADISIRRNTFHTWSFRNFFYNLYSYSIILPLIFGCFSFLFNKISNVFLFIFHRISRILFIKNN